MAITIKRPRKTSSEINSSLMFVNKSLCLDHNEDLPQLKHLVRRSKERQLKHLVGNTKQPINMGLMYE